MSMQVISAWVKVKLTNFAEIELGKGRDNYSEV